MGKADRIARQVHNFSLAELQDLQFFIEEQIERLKVEGQEETAEEEPQERKATVRADYKKCGKPGCHCNSGGELHGPYWYEYWKEDGRTRSRYLGKKAPSKQNRRKKS
jgi:hypothetical protein